MPKSPKFESFPLSKSRFLISPPYQTIRVTNCSRMQISDLFSLEDLHNRRPQQIIPSMGGVLRAKFENRTWSVRNAELLVYASFSVKTVDVTGKNHTWLHRFNNKKHIYFYNFGWIHLKHTRIAVAFFRWNFLYGYTRMLQMNPPFILNTKKLKRGLFCTRWQYWRLTFEMSLCVAHN